jgi:beta-lactamase superfamily II metal-dependent hydrolase
MLEIIIFNVERGFCAFVISPSKYGLLIDCGRSNNFSPLKYINDKLISKVTPYVLNGATSYKLTKFICSHPHDDHISDIDYLKNNLPPAYLQRRVFNPWDQVKDPENKDPEAYANLDVYGAFSDTYTVKPTAYPNWGFDLTVYSLTDAQVKEVNEDRQIFTNNSSYIVVLKYANRGIAFTGDMEADGWAKLLDVDKSFCDSLKGLDIFVTPHHGHKSGFYQGLYDLMGEGKPIINLVSEKSGDEVYNVYSDDKHSTGIKIDGETRRCFTTRQGTIFLTIGDDGTLSIKQEELPDNLE